MIITNDTHTHMYMYIYIYMYIIWNEYYALCTQKVDLSFTSGWPLLRESSSGRFSVVYRIMNNINNN